MLTPKPETLNRSLLRWSLCRDASGAAGQLASTAIWGRSGLNTRADALYRAWAFRAQGFKLRLKVLVFFWFAIRTLSSWVA